MRRSATKLLLAGCERAVYDSLGRLLSEIEEGDEFDLRCAETFEDALEEAARERYDLCLVDERVGAARLPELDAVARGHGYDLPLIFLASEGAARAVSEALKRGAADFLIREQLTPHALVRALRYARERARAEEALRASEKRYRDLVENANDIIYTHDLEGNVLSLNRAGELITGYARDEALSMNIKDVVAPEHLDLLRRMAERRLAEGTPTVYELEIVNKDGQRVALEVNTRLVYEGDRPAYVEGVARDVTGRKRAEEAVLRSEEQLLQSQKLEAIGRLAGGVAHDFNNLLTAITGYSDLSLRRLGGSDPVRRNIEEIKRAAARAAGLTRQLLAFSRKQVLQPKVLDLNIVVSEMEKMLRRLIGEDVLLSVNLGQPLGHVKADPGQIEQVVMNLAVNARDAMPGGGTLTIETENAHLDDTYASRHAGVRPGHYVVLSISDTGHGMDAETRRRIFEPFFTTKGQGKGTGLGLSTVYGIVRQSGGNVWVYSEPGLGTTFRVYLPLVEEEVERIKGSQAETEMPRGSETVLLVEDDQGVREMTREILEMCGYRVLVAGRPGEAARICEGFEGEIELLLTDVVMPHVSGSELADALTLLRPRMKVLYMSGYTDDAIVHHGVLDEGVAFLQKPFTPGALAHKLREVLDPRRETVHK